MEVVCAWLVRERKVWMGQRPEHKHNGGLWEFPGGKVGSCELPEAALSRELNEELHISPSIGEELGSVRHEYSDRTIFLTAYLVPFHEDVRPIEHEAGRWVELTSAAQPDWSEADIALWNRLEDVRLKFAE